MFFSPVAFLSRRIPNLSLDCLPLRLNALRSELHPDRGLALQVKLVARETREEVRLSDTRIPDQDNCNTKKKVETPKPTTTRADIFPVDQSEESPWMVISCSAAVSSTTTTTEKKTAVTFILLFLIVDGTEPANQTNTSRGVESV